MNPFLHRILSDVPMMENGALTALLNASVPGDVFAAEHPYFREMRAKLKPEARLVNGVSVLPVTGVLMRRPSPWEQAFGMAEDSVAVQEAIETAAANPEARALVLSIDSPGGAVMGGAEMAGAIAEARRKMPVVAHIAGMGASLAYMLAVEADAIVANPSAQVGSIGTVMAIADYSRMFEAAGVKVHVLRNADGEFKATGWPGSQLTEKDLAYYQSRVEAAFAQFRGAVMARRPGLASEHMRGQVYFADEAKRVGMVDAVGSLSYAIATARKAASERGAV